MNEIIGYHGTTIPNGEDIQKNGFHQGETVYFVLPDNRYIAVRHAMWKSERANLPRGWAIIHLSTLTAIPSPMDARYLTCTGYQVKIISIDFSTSPEEYQQKLSIFNSAKNLPNNYT